MPWARVSGQASTVLIVASGPSLRRFPFGRLAGKGFVIAVNDAWRFVPFANAWVTIDTVRMTQRFPLVFRGEKYAAVPADYGQLEARFACDRIADIPAGLHCLRRRDAFGLSEDPEELSGINSAFGALNFAYHLRPRRIVLFGIDGNGINYYFYGRRRGSPKADELFKQLPDLFASAATQLKNRNIEVINASPQSALTCFPKKRFHELFKNTY